MKYCMNWLWIGIVAVLVLSTGGPLFALDKPTAAVRKKEASALKKSAAAMVKSAKELTAAKAYDAALDELRMAALLSPNEGSITSARKKIGSKSGPIPELAAARVEKARKKARSACAKNLLGVLAEWEKRERPLGYAQLATTIRSVFGDDPAFSSLQLEWYEPYLVWTRPEDIKRWEDGDDCLTSGWLSGEAVAKQNEEHTNWRDPWVIDDGISEIRTAMPLRAANRVLLYVTSYRRFVTGFFGSDWEWKAPKGKLPIYLAKSQGEYQARIQDYNPGGQKSKAAAIYLQRSDGLCPVFVTFEPLVQGTPTKIEWHTLLRDVRHEVAHQLLYESCMAQGAAVGGQIDWVSEGIANYLGSYQPDRGAWRLAKVEQEPFGTGFEPGPFSWVKKNLRRVPSMETFFTKPKPNLESPQEYWIATTVTHFLLDGAAGRYRNSLVKLLIEVHMARGGSKSFSECFGKVRFDEIQSEFEDFVSAMEIDEG